MIVTINNETCVLKSECTIAQIAQMKNSMGGGTAIAVNGKIVRRQDWDYSTVKEGDDILIIKAAYGG